MGISFGRLHQLLPALNGNFLYILKFISFSRLCPLGPASVLAYRLDSTTLMRPCRSPGPSPKHALLRPLLGFVQLRRMHGSPAGPLSLPSRHNGRWRPPCLNCPPMVPTSAVTSPSYRWQTRLARAVCLPPNTGWRARPRTSAGKRSGGEKKKQKKKVATVVSRKVPNLRGRSRLRRNLPSHLPSTCQGPV